jgi:hypothetical protein
MDDVSKGKFLTLLGLEPGLLGRTARSHSLYRLSHRASWSAARESDHHCRCLLLTNIRMSSKFHVWKEGLDKANRRFANAALVQTEDACVAYGYCNGSAQSQNLLATEGNPLANTRPCLDRPIDLGYARSAGGISVRMCRRILCVRDTQVVSFIVRK